MSEKGDLISREALKICKHSNGYGYCSLCDQYCVEGPCKSEALIEYVPVVQGQWERKHSNVYCTACGKGYRIANGGPNVMTFVYCPHCGAKMDGKEDGADHE